MLSIRWIPVLTLVLLAQMGTGCVAIHPKAITLEELKARWNDREAQLKSYVCEYEEFFDITDSTPQKFQNDAYRERKNIVFTSLGELIRIDESVPAQKYRRTKAYDGKKSYSFSPVDRSEGRKAPDDFNISTTEPPHMVAGRAPRCFLNQVSDFPTLSDILNGAQDLSVERVGDEVVVKGKTSPTHGCDVVIGFSPKKNYALTRWEIRMGEKNEYCTKAFVDAWTTVDGIAVPQKAHTEQYAEGTDQIELIQRFEFKSFDFKKELDPAIFTLKPKAFPVRVYDKDLRTYHKIKTSDEFEAFLKNMEKQERPKSSAVVG
ncbi:MAG TPA: hypothetical protein PKH31_00135 [Candidatus Sumerlaeota bacterium]|nr:hypothetical protein [Candidatus Sumerlaeota bacterium]